jgi:hypothetical protein
VNTLEKIAALVDEVRTMPPDEASESSRGLIEMAQILAAFGIDPLAYLLPSSPAEADQMVDNLIAILLQVRGDDLPPFDLNRHTLDAEATGA